MFPFWFDPQMTGFLEAIPVFLGGVMWFLSGSMSR